jgi:hypothetical protein
VNKKTILYIVPVPGGPWNMLLSGTYVSPVSAAVVCSTIAVLFPVIVIVNVLSGDKNDGSENTPTENESAAPALISLKTIPVQ